VSGCATPSCTPSCEQKVCGDNGCGGSCGTCSTEQVCAAGRCVSSCPGGQKVCAGNCIPSNQCCTDAECPPAAPRCCGRTCVQPGNGVCCTAQDCPDGWACETNRCCLPEGSLGDSSFCAQNPCCPGLVCAVLGADLRGCVRG
jgi:hypothetical protein